MSLKDHKKGEEIVECECGCCKVVVDLYDWLDKKDEVGISFVSNYLGNRRNKLRAIWNCLKNKETYYAEAINKKEDVIKFLEDTLALLKAPAIGDYEKDETLYATTIEELWELLNNYSTVEEA